MKQISFFLFFTLRRRNFKRFPGGRGPDRTVANNRNKSRRYLYFIFFSSLSFPLLVPSPPQTAESVSQTVRDFNALRSKYLTRRRPIPTGTLINCVQRRVISPFGLVSRTRNGFQFFFCQFFRFRRTVLFAPRQTHIVHMYLTFVHIVRRGLVCILSITVRR